jgi:HAD superfamily hydrolase (TIGR01450 family)
LRGFPTEAKVLTSIIKQRLSKIGAVAFDLDGTTNISNTPLPFAKEIKDFLDRKGLQVVYVTNNSSVTKSGYLEKLTRMGIAIRGTEVIVSTEVAVQYIKDTIPHEKVFVVATQEVLKEIEMHGVNVVFDYKDAGCALLCFDTTLDYKKIRDLCVFLRGNGLFLATHGDINCPTDAGFIPDVGSFLALIEVSTGRKPDFVFGKPSEFMAKAISSKVNTPSASILYVGDRLYTDVAMANRFGMLSALVLTGETKEEDIAKSSFKPDIVARDLGQLMEILEDSMP